MEQVYQFTREQLVSAYRLWMEDYRNDPSAYDDYDDDGYDHSKYGEDSATILINYLERVKEI